MGKIRTRREEPAYTVFRMFGGVLVASLYFTFTIGNDVRIHWVVVDIDVVLLKASVKLIAMLIERSSYSKIVDERWQLSISNVSETVRRTVCMKTFGSTICQKRTILNGRTDVKFPWRSPANGCT